MFFYKRRMVVFLLHRFEAILNAITSLLLVVRVVGYCWDLGFCLSCLASILYEPYGLELFLAHEFFHMTIDAKKRLVTFEINFLCFPSLATLNVADSLGLARAKNSRQRMNTSVRVLDFD